MTDALKPCPFCGSDDILIDAVDGMRIWWVECDLCGVTTHSGERGGVIAAWNRRDAGWQPIASAPKDRLIIVCLAGVTGSTGEALWNGSAWEARDGIHRKFTNYVPDPTHWQPLPPPPEGGK